MKRQVFNRSRIVPVLFSVALLGAGLCAEADGLRKVTGSHHYTRPEDGPAGIESLDIQAVRRADGTVVGEAHNALRDGNVLVWHSHLRIDCMHFLDSHTVLIGGVDVWDSDPAYVGNRVAFVVRDNGEGQGADPDTRTTVYYSNDVGAPLLCEGVLGAIVGESWNFEADLIPTESGNIQVMP